MFHAESNQHRAVARFKTLFEKEAEHTEAVWEALTEDVTLVDTEEACIVLDWQVRYSGVRMFGVVVRYFDGCDTCEMTELSVHHPAYFETFLEEWLDGTIERMGVQFAVGEAFKSRLDFEWDELIAREAEEQNGFFVYKGE
ncbi:MAG: hypothetical protein ACRC5C_04180 [Bacilli bacterium]